jgi:hypothetical protein
MSDTTPLPDDIDALKAMLAEARALLAERDLVIEQLKAQIDKLRRMQFGRKSEQLDRQITQLETELEDLSAARGVADMRRAHARANASTATAEAAPKEALPSHLSREDHVLEPQPECPDCGQPMRGTGRGRVRAACPGRRGIQGDPHDPSQDGLSVLPQDHAATDAWPADRAQHRSPEPAGRHSRFEIRGSSTALPASADRGTRWRQS